MNALKLLEKQHTDLTTLFTKLGEEDKKFEQELVDAIEHHAFIEEMFFYPVLETKEETKGLVSKALKDHAKVKVLIHEWELSKSPTWQQLAEEIKTQTLKHIEEEKDVFDKVKQVFSEKELDKLGLQMLF